MSERVQEIEKQMSSKKESGLNEGGVNEFFNEFKEKLEKSQNEINKTAQTLEINPDELQNELESTNLLKKMNDFLSPYKDFLYEIAGGTRPTGPKTEIAGGTRPTGPRTEIAGGIRPTGPRTVEIA